MNIYEFLRELDDDEVESFVDDRIEQLEYAHKNDKSILGYYADETPKACYFVDDKKGAMTVRCFHKGYLKKGTKIVFGFSISPDGDIDNKGDYYYLNDQQYIYDFCKFIRHFDITNEYDLFDKILLFMRNYFGFHKRINRDDMFHLIYDENGKSFPLKHEHDLNWFKGKGSAMCSEFAVMAQNILSVLGIDTYVVLGAYTSTNNKTDNHAFNFVSIEEENEFGEIEESGLLVDFSEFCNIYNVKREKIGESPFIGYLDKFDDDFVLRFLYDEEHLFIQDYNYEKIGDTTLQISFDRDRDYFVNNNIITEKDKVAKKKKGR